MTTTRRKAKPTEPDAPLEMDVAGKPRYRGSLSMGDKNLGVEYVNKRLREMKLSPKVGSDQFTIDTYRGVVALQEANGLRATGRVDKTTWALL